MTQGLSKLRYRRVDWYRATLKALKQAIKQGLPVGGFVPWSCIDNMEWADGYTIRFGLIGIEYDANGEGSQKRYAKKSARYLNVSVSVFVISTFYWILTDDGAGPGCIQRREAHRSLLPVRMRGIHRLLSILVSSFPKPI